MTNGETSHCHDKIHGPEALEELLDAHRDRIFHYIFSLVPNRTDADDICQRSSVVMWKKFSSYDRTRCFLAWALGIAFFEIQNFRRTAGAERMMFSSETVESLATHFDQRPSAVMENRSAALSACLERLPQRDRLLVHYVYWCGDDYQSAAGRCGLAVRTVYNRMHLIRRQLLECVTSRLRQALDNSLD